MYNQHTRGMATTRNRSLVERGGRKALLETLHTHKKKLSGKTDVHESKEKIRAHIASSKAARLFHSDEVIQATSINRVVTSISVVLSKFVLKSPYF